MAEEKKTNNGYKLRVVGSVDNSAQSLRFPRDRNRKDVVLVPGQIITVSDNNGDLTKTEGERLQNIKTWKFEKE